MAAFFGAASSFLGRILSETPPTNGQVYAWNAAEGQFVPTTVGGGGGGSGTVTSVAAANTSVVIGGTPTVTPTVRTNTLDVIATVEPAAAAVPLNGQKITGLANGTASTDAAAFGQIPAALPPNGAAGGALTGTYPDPTLAAVGPGATGPIGSPTTTPVITINAEGQVTALTSATIAGGAGVSTVTAGDLSIVVGGTTSNPTIETGTLDEIATLHPPAAAVAMNAKKITGLANGSASTDACAYGQALILADSSAQVVSGAVQANGGFATHAITSGALPALSTLMSHIASGSTAAADQNTSGRDIHISVIINSTSTTVGNAALSLSADGVTYTVGAWKFEVNASVVGIVYATCSIMIPAGWYAEWNTFSASLTVDSAIYW
jgi:hypothetical protein